MKLHTAASGKCISSHAGIQPYAFTTTPTFRCVQKSKFGIDKGWSEDYDFGHVLFFDIRMVPLQVIGFTINDFTPNFGPYLGHFALRTVCDGGCGTASDLQVSAFPVPHPLDSVGRSKGLGSHSHVPFIYTVFKKAGSVRSSHLIRPRLTEQRQQWQTPRQ